METVEYLEKEVWKKEQNGTYHEQDGFLQAQGSWSSWGALLGTDLCC